MGCVVAFLGPLASYSHQAVLQDFPENEGFIHEPCGTFRDIFTAVGTGRAAYGVVPYENSTYGAVVDTLDLLADISSTSNIATSSQDPPRSPAVRVVGESYVAVNHTLLGRKSALPPAARLPASTDLSVSASCSKSGASGASVDSPAGSGTATPTPQHPSPLAPRSHPLCSLSHIQRVYSHPQAFGQSRAFLAAHLSRAERQEMASTSKAAALVAEKIKDGDFSAAAIAGQAAAELMGLDILAERIQEREHNFTRFLTLAAPAGGVGAGAGAAAAPVVPAFLREAGVERGEGHREGRQTDYHQHSSRLNGRSDARSDDQPDGFPDALPTKTLLHFMLDHTRAAALAAALATFAAAGLNLSAIHSRPAPAGAGPWRYVFFVECRGRPSDEPVAKALRELETLTEACRVLGWLRDRRGKGWGQLDHFFSDGGDG